MKNQGNRQKNVDLSTLLSSEDRKKIDQLQAYIEEKYDIPLGSLLKKQTDDFAIPISIFTQELGSFEAIIRYLREHTSLSNKEMAQHLGRKANTLSTVYHAALRKYAGALDTSSQYSIPLRILANRKLSVLEHICVYLHDEKHLSYSEIGRQLARSAKTIWTTYKRAQTKIHGR